MEQLELIVASRITIKQNMVFKTVVKKLNTTKSALLREALLEYLNKHDLLINKK